MFQTMKTTMLDLVGRVCAYDAAPLGHCAASLRTLYAYNPKVVKPPEGLSVTDLVKEVLDASTLASAQNEVAKALIGPATEHRNDARKALASDESSIMAWARWLQNGGVRQRQPSPLFRPSFRDESILLPQPTSESVDADCLLLAHMADVAGDDDAARINRMRGCHQSWAVEGLRAAFVRLSVFLKYDVFTSSQWFAGAIETPLNTDSVTNALTERALRVMCLVQAYALAWDHMHHREIARLLSTPVMAAILDTMGEDYHDEVKKACAWFLSRKLPKVLASAERACLDRTSLTPFGTLKSVGLSRAGAYETLRAYLAARRVGEGDTGDDGLDPATLGTAADLRDLTIETLAAELLAARRAAADARLACDETRLASTEAALGFVTAAGGPADLRLCGDVITAVVSDAQVQSEAIGDVWRAITAPFVPYREPDHSGISSAALEPYYFEPRAYLKGVAGIGAPRAEVQGRSLPPLRPIPYYIAPAEVQYDSGFALMRMSPRALKPLDDMNYFGDRDASIYPATFAGAAKALGITESRLRGQAELMKRLPKIITVNEQKGIKDGAIFRSTMTRKTSLRAVFLPAAAIPTEVLALDASGASTVAPTHALWIADPSDTQMKSPRSAVASALLDAAKEWL